MASPFLGLRTAQVSTQFVGAGASNVELALPRIEGQLIVPRFVTFQASSVNAGVDVMHVELSHYLNRSSNNGSDIGNMFDESTWLTHHFGPEHTVRYGMLDTGIVLAGPQLFCVYSSNGNQRGFMCTMLYETRTVAPIVWAAVAGNTSYED